VFAADLALLGITLLWGVSFTVTKDLLEDLPTPTLLALRFALAAAALLALRPRALALAGAGAWRAGLALGAILYGSFVLQTLGLAGTTPARSAFLTASYVFLVPLLGYAFGRERVGRGVAIGALLATAGLALLTRPEVTAEVRRGDVLSALCALGFAVHILGLGRVAGRVPAGPLALTQILGASALALLAGLLHDPAALAPAAFTRVGAGAWAGIAFLGLGCTALAYFVQTWAQSRTSAARAALIFALEPAFAALVSVALGREHLGIAELAGGGLIVAGVVVSEWIREPAEARRDELDG
jgi:drug/metabolite transporter (DMT)-like permease